MSFSLLISDKMKMKGMFFEEKSDNRRIIVLIDLDFGLAV